MKLIATLILGLLLGGYFTWLYLTWRWMANGPFRDAGFRSTEDFRAAQRRYFSDHSGVDRG